MSIPLYTSIKRAAYSIFAHTAHFFRSHDHYSTLRVCHMTNIEQLGSHVTNIEHFSGEYVESHDEHSFVFIGTTPSVCIMRTSNSRVCKIENNEY